MRTLLPHPARSSFRPPARRASPAPARSPCTSRASRPAPASRRSAQRSAGATTPPCSTPAGERPTEPSPSPRPHRRFGRCPNECMPTAMTDRLLRMPTAALCTRSSVHTRAFTNRAHLHNPYFYSISVMKRVVVMKLEDNIAGAPRAAADGDARRLDAQRRPGALRRPGRRHRRRGSSCVPPTWRSRCASHLPPRSSARASSSCLRDCCSTSLASCPARRCPSSCARPSRTSRVVSGSSRFHLRTLRAEDFPTPARAGRRPGRQRARRGFVATIAMVARAASRDETRPILTGILVSAQGSELRMVATDSYRLSVKETTLDPPIEGGFEANVPAPRAAGARAARRAGRGRADTHRRPRQPDRLRAGRHGAVPHG